MEMEKAKRVSKKRLLVAGYFGEFEVLTGVDMNSSLFWHKKLCSSLKNTSLFQRYLDFYGYCFVIACVGTLGPLGGEIQHS